MATSLTKAPRELRPGLSTPIELRFVEGGETTAVWIQDPVKGWCLYDPSDPSAAKATPGNAFRAIEITLS